LNTIEPSLSNHSHGSPCPHFEISSSPHSYRDPNDEETSLTTVLNSLLPFIRDQESTTHLSIYLGKFVINPPAGVGEASCLCSIVEGVGKDFFWSRGLGLEHSSVKTRSALKKSTILSSLETNTCTTTEGGALRELKALAQAK
jgi:hypothetical protein